MASLGERGADGSTLSVSERRPAGGPPERDCYAGRLELPHSPLPASRGDTERPMGTPALTPRGDS